MHSKYYNSKSRKCSSIIDVYGPVGPTGPVGSIGDTGPIGPSGDSNTMGKFRGFNAIIEIARTINADTPLIFDKIITNQDPSILLGPLPSSDITFTHRGNYFIEWWLAFMGLRRIELALVQDNKTIVSTFATEDFQSNQVYGNSIITVATTPSVVKILNLSTPSHVYSGVPVKGGVVIYSYST